ncbi:MAG: CDP-alcohol phosphatidyltransferase family protein [Kiritimatiellae bacterium]|nr:CDP-alcohol phosphatidyltransferase family protein [Kiritimatiellia bacterium]
MTTKTHMLLVNTMTLGRMPFVLLFMAMAIYHARFPVQQGYAAKDFWAVGAALSLTIAALSDLYDGKLARKWKVVSKFGAMADPLMDKVFYVVVFPTLMWLVGRHDGCSFHALSLLFLTVIYTLRDQWVTFLRSVAANFPNADCSALWLGKFRTASTFPVAIFIYLWVSLHPVFIPLGFVLSLEGILIVVTLWTAVSYTKVYFPFIKKSLE